MALSGGYFISATVTILMTKGAIDGADSCTAEDHFARRKQLCNVPATLARGHAKKISIY